MYTCVTFCLCVTQFCTTLLVCLFIWLLCAFYVCLVWLFFFTCVTLCVSFFFLLVWLFSHTHPLTHNCYLVELYSVETHLSHTMPPLGFLSGDILLALVWYWGGSRLLLYTLSLWNKGFTHTHIHLSHHASIGISQWRHFISISVILRGV